MNHVIGNKEPTSWDFNDKYFVFGYENVGYGLIEIYSIETSTIKLDNVKETIKTDILFELIFLFIYTIYCSQLFL